jgi:hypothetical protein
MDDTVHNLDDFLHALLPDWVLDRARLPFRDEDEGKQVQSALRAARENIKLNA